METNSLYCKHSRPKDTALKVLINLAAGVTVVVLVGIIGYILVNGLPYVTWQFISTPYSEMNPDQKGILPMIINTLYIVVITLLIAVPIGLSSAIYLTQYAKQGRLVRSIRFTTEVLSGIPSIIFGLFGYTVFCILFRLQVSILAGCLTMTICILPTIVRTTEESLMAVPTGYKEVVIILESRIAVTIETEQGSGYHWSNKPYCRPVLCRAKNSNCFRCEHNNHPGKDSKHMHNRCPWFCNFFFFPL